MRLPPPNGREAEWGFRFSHGERDLTFIDGGWGVPIPGWLPEEVTLDKTRTERNEHGRANAPPLQGLQDPIKNLKLHTPYSARKSAAM